MAHTNDGSSRRQAKETQVTTRQGMRKRALAAAMGAMAGGVGIAVGLLTGDIDPGVTHAVVAVATATVVTVRYLLRRPAVVVETTPKGDSAIQAEVGKAA